MLVAVITDLNKYSRDALQRLTTNVEAVELRLDYFNSIDHAQLQSFVMSFELPIIFTLRKKEQGGKYCGTEEQRLSEIKNLIRLNPTYFDIECDVPKDEIEKIHQQNQNTKLLCSYHNFYSTPKDLNKLLDQMISPFFYAYKIATYAQDSLDALKMLIFLKKRSNQVNLAGLCMGYHGAVTRILSPIFGGFLNYSYCDPEVITAPGQISFDELFDVYNYKQLNYATKMFFLLGSPVDHSKGHIFHNNQFKKNSINAVYVKVDVSKNNLEAFLELAKQLPFSGASVTMPLKEMVSCYLDKIDDFSRAAGSVNTIAYKNSLLSGTNTDANTVLCLLEQYISIIGKNVLVFGAGGVGRAISYLLSHAGANVFIFNRSVDKACKVANMCAGSVITSKTDLFDFIEKHQLDVFINATSLGMNSDDVFPFDQHVIEGKTIVLDMVANPKLSFLSDLAKLKKCIYISGKDVFVNQAIRQLKYWFGSDDSVKLVSEDS